MHVRLKWSGLIGAMALAVGAASAQGQVSVDMELPEYKASRGVAGSLTIIGSDTMKHEMQLLIAGFTKFYPNVRPEIESKGSSSAPPALIAGTAQFAPMSRGMKAREVSDFRKRFGYPPVALPTSIDMVSVYVHKDNPIKGLTLQQVDAMFSSTRKGGYAKPIDTWGDLGLTGEWQDKPISLHGRNATSGTQLFFREHALFNGAFRTEVREQPDSASVVEGVAGDRYAIGYSGIGYKADDVRVVPLALDVKSEYYAAEPRNAYSGDYPLTRTLLLYVNHQPGVALDPLRREFIRYVYSRQGQEDVVQSGYLPLGQLISKRALALVDLKLGETGPEPEPLAKASPAAKQPQATATPSSVASTARPARQATSATYQPRRWRPFFGRWR